MKAAIHNPYLDTLGGGERYTLSFAKVLSDCGYDVHLSWPQDNILDKLTRRFGIKVERLKIVSDIKKGEGYDICFWVSDGSLPLLRARNNILHFQVPFTKTDGNSLINRMKLFRVNSIVCNSHFTKKFIDKTYGVNSLVIYPPVDVERIKGSRKNNVILSVGRFSQLKQAKRQDVLIAAFKKFYSKNKNWKLIFAGGTEVGVGGYLEKLVKQAAGLPIEFEKSPNFTSLMKLFSKSKIFWTASGYGIDETKEPDRVEHFGMSLVEAMAAGCVPFVFAAGGHKEIIENERNGYLWHNTNELVKQTSKLINDKDKFQETSSQAIARSKKFSFQEFEKQISSLL